LSVPGGAPAVAVGDFNADHKKDLGVTASREANKKFAFLRGRGNGTFADPLRYHAGTSAGALAVGRFNDDQRSDVAVLNPLGSNETVTVLLSR